MHMAIEIKMESPSAQQSWELFQSTGWNDKYQLSVEELHRALQSSWYMVSVYDAGQLVAFGRIVSDGILHAMIYEMIVLPAYQGQGIGRQVLQRLLERCEQARIRDIQLFCARGKRGFYEKFGFAARPDDAPGMYFVQKG